MGFDEPGALPYQYWVVQNSQVERSEGGVIEESVLHIYVNGQSVASLLCSPLDQEALALGFLYSEGIITSMADVGLVQANVERSVVDVLLRRADFTPARRIILTSGCGGGVTFQDLTGEYPPLHSDFAVSPEIVLARMRDLQQAARLYHLVRGVHAAVLAAADGLLASAEDIGRHNAVDKLAGKALLGGIETRDRVILTSGRISSEMLNKAWRMGVPLVASRTAPTSTAVRLASAWNICIVGYVRQGSMRIYTHPQRVGLAVPQPHEP